jgi:predicted dienelactone hydrolase
MNNNRSFPAPTILVLISLILSACSPAAATPTAATTPQKTRITPSTIQATSTTLQDKSTPTKVPETPTDMPVEPQGPITMPLSERGPQQTGRRSYTFQDPNLEGREVSITVLYPAVLTEDQAGRIITDAPPDPTGAPYPVVLSSSKVAGFFGVHLVSHGFVYVGINNNDQYDQYDQNLIDQPLDLLFALNQIGVTSLNGLEGMLDIDRSGVTGYSFDGYNSLALSGARIDPGFFLEQCRRASTLDPPFPELWFSVYCDLAARWDDFEDHAGVQITASDDGLWQPMTDPRILAVIPLAMDGAWLFGERGLAAVDRPTLIMMGTTEKDAGLNFYEREAVYIYEHLGTPDRFLISFIGREHNMIYLPTPLAQMKHFMTAFFGYYLQGRQDYTGYFSEGFVSQYDDLAWGVYTGK